MNVTSVGAVLGVVIAITAVYAFGLWGLVVALLLVPPVAFVIGMVLAWLDASEREP